jgi:hypothetical protein
VKVGDRVRVKLNGRTGRIMDVVDAGNTKRYLVSYDAEVGPPRPRDGTNPSKAAEDWSEENLERIPERIPG